MKSVANRSVTRFSNTEFSQESDLIVVEEPLEIRLGYGSKADRSQERLMVTMRTPGNDFDLAKGILFSENIINDIDQISSIHYCETVKPEEEGNVIRVELLESVSVDWSRLKRNFYTNSACGVCGKSSIEEALQSCDLIYSSISVASEVVRRLPEKLNDDQLVFRHTGGIHAVGLFDTKGELIKIMEDVGRHNALDKLIGFCLSSGVQLSDKVLLLSGRISYELVQKSARAGIPIVCAVGAPSSLAVSLAESTKMTLVGFLKENYFNIYTGDRVI